MNSKGRLFSCCVAAMICLSAAVMPARAQTLPTNPIEILTNLPSVSLSAETFGVAVGTVAHDQGTSFSSLLQGRYVVHTNFAFGAESEFGNNNTTIEKLGAFLELRKPWDAYEFYGLMGARKQWSPNNWEGFAGLGASWMPAASLNTSLGVFQKGALFIEDRLVIELTKSGLKERPLNEVVAGFRVSF